MPKKVEPIEECKKGPWAEKWATALSGISREEARKNSELKKRRELLKEKACRSLLSP